MYIWSFVILLAKNLPANPNLPSDLGQGDEVVNSIICRTIIWAGESQG